MDKLHRYRSAIRGGATRILAWTSELLQDSEPAVSDLLVAIEDLEEKDATLNELNATIADHLDGKFEDEISSALVYHDKIRNAISRLRYILSEKYDLRTEKTTVRAAPLPTYLLKAVKRERELSSTVDLGETQTDSVEYNVAQAYEETCTDRES